MKILIGCSSRLDKGSGILAYCLNQAQYYLRQGHVVYILAPFSKSYKNVLVDNQISLINFDMAGQPQVEVLSIYKKIIEIQPDLVVNNDNCFLQQLAPFIDCPFYFVMHLANYTIGALAKINSEYVDKYVAISNDMKDRMISRYNIPTSKIIMIHNGFNTKINSNVNSNKNEGIIVTFAGEFTKRKGADLFIDLTNKLKNDKRFHFHWTAGSEKFKAERLINNKQVTIYGKLPKSDFFNLLESTDVLVMPSREEGCPMALLEALGKGVVPIVSNGEGAMKEIIEHGWNGFVCDINNWANQAFDLLHVINKEKLAFMSSNGEDTFNKSYASGEYAHKILKDMITLTGNKKVKPEYIRFYSWHRPESFNVSFFTSIRNKVFIKLGIIPYVGKRSLKL